MILRTSERQECPVRGVAELEELDEFKGWGS